MDFFVEFSHKMLGDFKISYMRTDHYAGGLIFCQLMDVLNAVKFIGKFMFQSGCYSDFVYDRLAKYIIVSKSIKKGSKDGFFLSFAEIPINNSGLFWIENKIIKGNKCEQ